MPEVSTFYGIRITINYNDHLPPHFHAEYGDDEVLYNFRDLTVYEGALPRRAMRMVEEWAALHQEELLIMWGTAQALQPIGKIQPLP